MEILGLFRLVDHRFASRSMACQRLVLLFHPQGIVVPVHPLIDARPDNLGEPTNPCLPGNQERTVLRNLPAMKGVSGSALFGETVVRVKGDGRDTEAYAEASLAPLFPASNAKWRTGNLTISYGQSSTSCTPIEHRR